MSLPTEHLRFLLDPASIAVVGASDGPGPGRQVIDNLQRLGYEGTIVPINPQHEVVQNRRCFPSLAAASRAGLTPEAVAILLGRAQVPQVLEEAAAAGIRGAWAFASGFGEADPQGIALQQHITEICTKYGIAFCGPNCVGYVNPVSRCGMYSAPVSPSLAPGVVSAVVQADRSPSPWRTVPAVSATATLSRAGTRRSSTPRTTWTSCSTIRKRT